MYQPFREDFYAHRCTYIGHKSCLPGRLTWRATRSNARQRPRAIGRAIYVCATRVRYVPRVSSLFSFPSPPYLSEVASLEHTRILF